MSGSFLTVLGPGRVYPLTDRSVSGLSHSEQVTQLSRRGARVIQLREKLLPLREFYEDAAAALKIARELGVKIIVNDRVDLALALHADGVHLGQDDMTPEAARGLLGPNSIIGVSTHNLDQAQIAASAPVDYVAIGPIFPTSTKESNNPPVGLAGIREVRTLLRNLPLVAIGGITLSNKEQVLGAGADAVAVIRDLWASSGAFDAAT